MTSVLIVFFSSQSSVAALASTLLWRQDVRHVAAASADEALRLARRELPRLVVVEASEHGRAVALLRTLRGDPHTRTLSLAGLRTSVDFKADQELRDAGANLVLAGSPLPFLWDTWIEELLSVPRRKAARIAVEVEVWTRDRGPASRSVGHTVNVSTRGILLETRERLENGSTLDLEFRLPHDGAVVAAVGRVVRQAGEPAGSDAPMRWGIKLLRIGDRGQDRLASFVESGNQS